MAVLNTAGTNEGEWWPEYTKTEGNPRSTLFRLEIQSMIFFSSNKCTFPILFDLSKYYNKLTSTVGEDSWESLGQQGDPSSPSYRSSVLNIHWKDWRWSWNSNTLATWCEELTHLKSPWCWERLKAGGEGDDRGWDGWMASLTQWAWVWVGSGSWWWTGRPGVLQSMGSQRVGHNWATELNWLSSVSPQRRPRWDRQFLV